MRRLSTFRYQTGDGDGLVEGLRESFTKSFAYDLFDWIATPGSSSVDLRPLVNQGAIPRSDDADSDPVSAYTTNADIPVYILGEVVPFEGEAGVFPQTSISGPLVAIDDFRADARFAGIDGSGYTIAVLDTGIDLDDPFFGPDSNGDGVSDRIVFHYDFADGDADGSDFHNHGSNVASIAASSDSTYTGMAPGANIAALKVFSNSGSGNFGDIEDALDWVIANAAAYNIVSVNMSLSDGGNYSSAIQLYGIADELAALAAMDVIVVSASGNDFYEFNSIQGVAYPSADPNSLSVGAVYEGSYNGWSYGSGAIANSTTTDQITPFSQRDDQLSDIFAPGAPITGAGAGSGLVTMHGTSQAAPHIAGIIALAQELAVQELGRKLTFDEIAQLLQSSGDTIIDGDDEDDNVNNTGLAFQRVNVLALGEAILAMAPTDARGDTYFELAGIDAALPEGDSGTTAFTFEITRSGDLTAADSVDYSVTGSGPAPADAGDFSGVGFPSGSVTFEIGETSKLVTIEVTGDSEVETDEGFALTIDSVPPNGQVVVASAEATIENDDEAAPGPGVLVLLQADFDQAGNTEGFIYLDGLFGGTTAQNYADGDWADQALEVNLGGINNSYITNMSGGWQSSFTLDTETEVSLSFLYNLTIDSDYERDEFTQVLVSIDGGAPVLVDQLTGDGNGGSDQTTGPQTFNAVLGMLPGGSHTLEIGALNNKKTYFNETSQLTIDDVVLTGTVTSAVTPSTFFEISADDAVKAEGDAGSSAFSFTVTRSGDTSAAGAVDYAVSGADVDGADFLGGSLPAGTLAFLAGETSKTITLEVAGDTDFESDEAFTITLSNASAGSEITTPSAGGSILNDDAAPPATFFAIAADDAVKAEGDAGSTAFSFTVTRSGDTSAAGAVDYAVGGVDVNGADFLGGSLPGGTLAFLAGETSKTITLEVAGDTDFEVDEGFTVALTNPSAGSEITTTTANGSILNDDAAPPATFLAIAAADAVKAEGDAGSTAFSFTVTRSGDTSAAGSVDFAVSGSDVDSLDFLGGTLPGGTVNFLAGEASTTLTIEVAGDSDFEGDEGFTVTLSNPSAGSAITTLSAGGSILNDDFAPPATFFAIAADDAVKAEGDAGSSAFSFTVTRSGDTSAAGAVDYAVSGADVDGADFLGGSLPGGTLAFLAGETSKTITLEVAGDTDFEVDEAFTVTLSNASAGSAITTASAGGTILNDDAAPPGTFLAIVAADAVKAEGDAGSTAFTFTVTRSGDTSAAGAVDYAVSGAAIDGADFLGGSLPGGTLAFLAGETSKTLTLEVAGDTDFEVDEAFTVTLSNASAGTAITTPSAGGTILNDDVAPPATFLAIAADDAVKAEGDAGSTAFTFTVTRSGDTSAAGAVDYAVSGANVDGADFLGGSLPGGTVNFLAGQASTTLTIEVAGDSDFEGDEDFTVTLSNPSAGSAITAPSANGTIVNDDVPAPAGPLVLIDDSFDGGSGSFVYEDGSFGGADPQSYAVGAWQAGALTIDLGGIDGADITDMSGGWTTSFTLAAESEVSLSFFYELIIASGYEPDEFSQVMVSLDGGAPILVDSLTGDGNGGLDQTTGQQSFNGVLGILAAGSHEVTIGGFNNKKTIADEISNITIDDVLVTATPTAPIDAMISIAALDPSLAEGDAGTTIFTFDVTRSGDLSAGGSVDYTVSGSSDDPAEADDFLGGLLPSGTVSFLAGEASQTIVIEVAGDTNFEGNEGFTVTLSDTSFGLGIDSGTAQSVITNDDPLPAGPVVLIDESFDGDSGDFIYSDGVFGGADPQANADGNLAGGALVINLGGGSNSLATDMSGAWEIDFVLADDMDVSLSFSYELILAADYESDELSQVLVSLDGGVPILIDELIGDGNGGVDQTTGLQSLELDLGSLAAGSHSLAIGGVNNKKTWSNETTEITIDDVMLTGTATSPGLSEQELLSTAGL